MSTLCGQNQGMAASLSIFPFNSFLSAYVHESACEYVFIYVYVCGNQRTTLRGITVWGFYILRWGLSLGLQLTDSAKLAN